MKDRPILFSSSMVRAILDGKKTQTRRVCRGVEEGPGGWPSFAWGRSHGEMVKPKSCPYGKPGDRLWVRETWRTYSRMDECACYDDCRCPATGATIYRADYSSGADEDKWRPSIFMPRDRSRLTLEITGVRVERVQAISEADARAEGVLPNWCGDLSDFVPERDGFLPWWPKDGAESVEGVDPYDTLTAKEAYAMLWQSINGKKPGASWADNPFVWVVEFKRVEGEAAR